METWGRAIHANVKDFFQDKEWYKISEQETIVDLLRAEQTTTYIAPYRKRWLLRKH